MAGKILIVDDDTLMLEILRSYMARQGYEIALAKDGFAAVEAAEQEMPAAIVMDVVMPGPGGLEVLRYLKHHAVTRHIPIIVMTAKDSMLVEEEARLAGASAFRAKPFAPAQLMAEIRRVTRAEPGRKGVQ